MKNKSKKYSIKFNVEKSLHIYIKCKLNGKKGHFLVDTGASNSCISTAKIDIFNLNVIENDSKAFGLGAMNLDAQLSSNNTLKINELKIKKFNLVVFDMQHIDNAIEIHQGKPIDGILGADLLIKYKAVIDYSKNRIVFLDK